MPTTNRPFFGSFLSAFRAHSVLQKTTTGPTTQSSYVQSTGTSNANTNGANSTIIATQAKAITTKSSQASAGGATTVALSTGQFQPNRQHTASSYSRSPGSTGTNTLTPLQSRGRRGSDSSSEGFRETSMGAEKWYIGGRTAGGEERVYKLSMVKRPRSIDRMSLDRMSL